jgi:hypothetical protein
MAMQTETNLSEVYRLNIIHKLKQLAESPNLKFKHFKDMTREDVTEFLDKIRKAESIDPLHKWVGTYEISRIILLRFFRWLLRGYPLVSRALRYVAKKLRTLKDDEAIKVRDELITQGLEHRAEYFEELARKYDEQHIYLETRPPPNEAPDILAKKDKRFSDPYRKDVCFALRVYSTDLIASQKTIAERFMWIKPTSEELKTFLKIDDIDSQLGYIVEAMMKDYCRNTY